jgi:3-keto-disaccharide hydrolase
MVGSRLVHLRRRGRSVLHRVMLAGLLVGSFASPAAPAAAQYVAPPPDPGFEYIFNGTATGSDASFDKWVYSSSTAAASATQGRATVDPAEGAILVGASAFGGYWYPVRAFGDAVIRLQYTVQDIPTSTRNGGIVVRAPEVRYTGATTSEVLAQKPTGYNYDVCPGALPVCGRDTPAQSTTYSWEGAEGPFPPASDASDPPFAYSGTYCARPGTNNVTNLTGTGLAPTGSVVADNQHWSQLYCGNEIQVNESLSGGGPNPSSDPIKTGSIYGFRNLNAKQSKTNERLEKGVWHDMEIRTIGQQYSVLIDGELINQFDNSIPKISTAEWGGGYPPTMARQLARGYIGLQTHGGNDRISYREIQVKEIGADEIPVNVEPPEVGGSGRVGRPLTCARGEWENTPGADYWLTWYRSNRIGPEHPRYRAPSQFDLGNYTTPAEPEFGTDPLPWTDSLIVGRGKRYTPTAADVGKVIHCQVSASSGGATVWTTAAAPEIGAP